jgi:hypothetical protein
MRQKIQGNKKGGISPALPGLLFLITDYRSLITDYFACSRQIEQQDFRIFYAG